MSAKNQLSYIVNEQNTSEPIQSLCPSCHKICSKYVLYHGEQFADLMCYQCHQTKLSMRCISLKGYLKILRGRLRTNLRYQFKKYGKMTSMKFTICDLIDMYMKQNGICAISGKLLTHYVPFSSNQMQIMQPDNIVIELLQAESGYVLNNMRLVCAASVNLKQAPGLICDFKKVTKML